MCSTGKTAFKVVYGPCAIARVEVVSDLFSQIVLLHQVTHYRRLSNKVAVTS